MASLAAILLSVGYNLSKFSLYKRHIQIRKRAISSDYRNDNRHFEYRCIEGVAIYFILRKNHKHFYPYKKEEYNDGDVITIVLSEEVTFLNKGSIGLTLDHLPENSKVIIDGTKSLNTDYNALEIIQEFKAHPTPAKNIRVETIGIDSVATVEGHEDFESSTNKNPRNRFCPVRGFC